MTIAFILVGILVTIALLVFARWLERFGLSVTRTLGDTAVAVDRSAKDVIKNMNHAAGRGPMIVTHLPLAAHEAINPVTKPRKGPDARST